MEFNHRESLYKGQAIAVTTKKSVHALKNTMVININIYFSQHYEELAGN